MRERFFSDQNVYKEGSPAQRMGDKLIKIGIICSSTASTGGSKIDDQKRERF